MGELKPLKDAAREKAELLSRLALDDCRIGIIGHFNADGISASSILAKAIQRKGGKFTARAVRDASPATLRQVKESGFEFHVFCDIGAGQVEVFSESFGELWMTVDHNQIQTAESDPKTFNAWSYSFDGSTEISGAGMAYLIAVQMEQSNRDLSWLPIVGALAERQDRGNRHALMGLNMEIVDEAKNLNLLKEEHDILLYGRETRPIHESLASTSSVYLPGLTGNRDACLATLTSAGLKLRDDNRWRTLSELSEDEKRILVDTVIAHLGGDGDTESQEEELVGTVYTLLREDEFSPMRDARELGSLLNACGRMLHAGLGISICMGDRGKSLFEAEEILAEYRQSLGKAIQAVLEDSTRVTEDDHMIFVKADGIVNEDILGPVTSLLSSSQRFTMRPLFIVTEGKERMTRLSARSTRGCSFSLNLGKLLSDTAKEFDGIGGGHQAAAGAMFPTPRLPEVLKRLKDGL